MQTQAPRTRRLTLTALAGVLALAGATIPPAAAAADWGWGKGERVQGSGNVKHETRAVGHFSGLALALPGDAEVRTGAGREGVTIEADDNLLPLIETVVEDGTLKIRNKRGATIRPHHLKILVQARALDRLALASSGAIDADAVRGPRVQFDIGGSGTIKVGRIETEALSVNLGGSGDLKGGDGSARTISISVGGSGTVDLGRVRSDSASVTVGGAGDATLWVRDSLSLTVAGSGNVAYYGDPHVSTSIVGSGKVRRLGAAPH